MCEQRDRPKRSILMARTGHKSVQRGLRNRAAGIVVSIIVAAAQMYAEPLYSKIPYHTSLLTGEMWVQELLAGHPCRIKTELGMQCDVFIHFVKSLVFSGLKPGRSVSYEEQAAIFLYACITGLSTRHLGERFQRSNDTISHYFRAVLYILSSSPFYGKYVCLPLATSSIPTEIQSNPKFFPFFEGAIGAVDGTHIACCPSAPEHDLSRNRKGWFSQNCLACCSFDMQFQYVLSGWDGSAADAAIFNNARQSDLRVPPGRYYLADAGFGACASLLIPYRGVRYHLAEWGRAGTRPANREELFNLRHSSARNAVERIFGILKQRCVLVFECFSIIQTVQTTIQVHDSHQSS